jgi:hypothetical protein
MIFIKRKFATMYLMSTKANLLPGLTNDKFPTPLKLLETNIRRLRVNDLNKPSQLAYSQNEKCQITAQGATANAGENFLSRRTDKPKRCLLHRDCWDDSKRQGQKTWRISKRVEEKDNARHKKKEKGRLGAKETTTTIVLLEQLMSLTHKKLPDAYGRQKFHHHLHKSPPMNGLNLSQINPVLCPTQRSQRVKQPLDGHQY